MLIVPSNLLEEFRTLSMVKYQNEENFEVWMTYIRPIKFFFKFFAWAFDLSNFFLILLHPVLGLASKPKPYSESNNRYLSFHIIIFDEKARASGVGKRAVRAEA